MASCGMSMTGIRLKFVEFTHFTQFDNIAFISRYPQIKLAKWIIFEPLTWKMWIIIICSLFFLAITLYFISKYQQIPLSFSTVLLELFGIILSQCKQI